MMTFILPLSSLLSGPPSEDLSLNLSAWFPPFPCVFFRVNLRLLFPSLRELVIPYAKDFMGFRTLPK